MGYVVGDTGAAGVTGEQRRAVLGRCIDANTLQSIMAIAAAWHRQQQWVAGKAELLPVWEDSGELEQAVGLQQSASMALSRMGAGSPAAQPCEVTTEQYLIGIAVAAVAEAQEADSSDIWQDQLADPAVSERTDL